MKKRAQSEIITTVILVLIALAAVAIIAVFFLNQVRTNTATAESRANCIKLDLEITKAVNNTGVIIVKRNDAEASLNTAVMKVTVDGATWNSTGVTVPAALTTTNITGATLSTGQKVEIGAVLADNTTVCATKVVKTVTAA
jgi:flagellin-like protein